MSTVITESLVIYYRLFFHRRILYAEFHSSLWCHIKCPQLYLTCWALKGTQHYKSVYSNYMNNDYIYLITGSKCHSSSLEADKEFLYRKDSEDKML